MLAAGGLPDVPTFAEQGVPRYAYCTWLSLVVPVGTPQPVVEKLAEELKLPRQ